MQKYYVLDTNILIQTNGQAIYGFDDNVVIITATTLEELDKLKTAPGETGYSARQSIKIIKELRNQGNYLEGIPINKNGIFKIVTNHLDAKLPRGWSLEHPDNRIICTAKTLTEENKDIPVALITNDAIMMIKALSAEVDSQDYQNEQINFSENDYTGRITLVVDDMDIDRLYAEKSIAGDVICEDDLQENIFVVLKSAYSNKSALGWYKQGRIYLIQHEEDYKIYGVQAKNAAQRFALEALMAPVDEIPLVILKGPAGCGKTFLAMAAGLEQTYSPKKEAIYDKVVISRSNCLSDEEMGFLPGDIRDKMTPLLSPFFDNLQVLIRHGYDEDREQVQMQIDELIDEEIVEICPLAYIRGRSIPHAFIIIDEAQNLTITQAKTIITRAGIGTKVIFLGDPDQIDNNKVSRRSNGLVYMAEKFKGNPLCAQIEFNKEKECVRSALAQEAITVLMPDAGSL